MVVIRKGEIVGVRERERERERERDGREEERRRRVVGEELASWCEIQEGVMKKGDS